jgi:hypothetical protein
VFACSLICTDKQGVFRAPTPEEAASGEGLIGRKVNIFWSGTGEFFVARVNFLYFICFQPLMLPKYASYFVVELATCDDIEISITSLYHQVYPYTLEVQVADAVGPYSMHARYTMTCD